MNGTAPTSECPASPVVGTADGNTGICSVERLHKAFGGIRAVWDLSFSIPHRQVIGLIGPNGSGKTTVMNLIAGYHRPDAGNVYFNNRRLTGLSAHEIARAGVIRTWQDPRTISHLTVRQNVELGAFACGGRAEQEEGLIDALIDEFQLRTVEHQLAGALPYGTLKIIALARSLAARPKMLLLDEPLAGLSSEHRDCVIAAVQHFRGKGAVLIVDHSFGVIAQLCDRVLVLNTGSLLAEGTPSEIAANPKVAEVYFG
jgi:branched-chain amino acid transport system ATP-binding protein